MRAKGKTAYSVVESDERIPDYSEKIDWTEPVCAGNIADSDIGETDR